MKMVLLVLLFIILCPMVYTKDTVYKFNQKISENIINESENQNIVAIYKSSSEMSKDYVKYFILAALISLGIILIKNVIHSKSNC
jgi:ABC-type glycerol-3-phosphate transport system permease component